MADNTLLSLSKSNLSLLYNMDFANLNLIYPRYLWVGGLLKSDYTIKRIIDSDNLSAFGNFLTSLAAVDATSTDIVNKQLENAMGAYGFQSNDLATLQSISNVKFKSLPLQKSNGTHTLKAKGAAADNNNSLCFNFLLGDDLHTLSAIDAWRDMWYSETLKITGSGADEKLYYKEGIQVNDPPNGQGVFIADFYKNNGEVAGTLYVLGLIPTQLDALDKVGPGLDAQSSLPTVSLHCIYSFGFIEFTGDHSKRLYLV